MTNLSIVTRDNLGIDFDLGTQTPNKISIVAATQAAAGKVKFANGAELAANTPGVVLDVPNTNALIGARSSFKNKIINGSFRINQRGYVSGASLASTAYGLDRWRNGSGSAGAFTFTQAAQGFNSPPGPIDGVLTIPSDGQIQQIIDSVNNEGGVFTLSWLGSAVGSLAYSDGANYIGVAGTGASPLTGPIPAGATIYVQFTSGTLGLVQLEAGKIATPFERRPYSIELLLCQRFYQTGIVNVPVSGSAAYVGGSISLLGAMRVTPSVMISDLAGAIGKVSTSAGGNGITPNGGSIATVGTTSLLIDLTIPSSPGFWTRFSYALSAEF